VRTEVNIGPAGAGSVDAGGGGGARRCFGRLTNGIGGAFRSRNDSG
jgi:hypothetical protein